MALTERILDVLPHYIALLLSVFVVLAVVRSVFGDLGFIIELLIVLAVAFVYPPVVRRLGVAPEAWTKP